VLLVKYYLVKLRLSIIYYFCTLIALRASVHSTFILFFSLLFSEAKVISFTRIDSPATTCRRRSHYGGHSKCSSLTCPGKV
jgi:hypothetical protein